MNDLHQIRIEALSEALAHRALALNDLKRAEQAVDDAWEALTPSLQGLVARPVSEAVFGATRPLPDPENPFQG